MAERYQILETEKQILASIASIETKILETALERKKATLEANLLGISQQTHQKKLDELYEKLHDTQQKIAKAEENRLIITRSIQQESIKPDDKKAQQALLDETQANINNLQNTERALVFKMREIELQEKYNEAEKKAQDSKAESIEQFMVQMMPILSSHNQYYNVLKKIGVSSDKLANIYASIAVFVKTTFDIFLKLDKELADFRISMGMFRSDSEIAERNMRNIVSQFTFIGITIKIATDSVKSLANELGGVMVISNDLVETTALLKAQLGVAEDASAGFLKNIAALNKSTAQSQKHMAYFASALSAAAGVRLNDVMQDVAKMSNNALLLISRMPSQIIKTAVAARQLGTSINRMADASASLLNFTESVQAEMNASVLIGRAVNLQLARELAYKGKILESTKAIMEEARKVNFENLDYFQMKAFADATGRTVEELLNMIQTQRQLEAARNDPKLRAMVDEYERLMNIRENDIKNESLQRELTVKRLANQERMAILQQQWNQLFMNTMDLMYPFFDISLRIANVFTKIGPPLSFMYLSLEMVLYFLKKFPAVTNTWNTSLTAISNLFAKFRQVKIPPVLTQIFSTLRKGVEKVKEFKKMLLSLKNAFAPIGRLFSVFRFAAPFIKGVPVLGWIITAIHLIVSAVKNFGAVFRKEMKLTEALKNIVYEVLLKPFHDIWNWVLEKLGAGSPSEMMWSVIHGIVAAGPYIFDALTSPYRKFLAWVVNKIPIIGSTLSKQIESGLSGLTEKREVKVAPINAAPVAEITSNKGTSVKNKDGSESELNRSSPKNSDATLKDNSDLLSEILKSLNVLNSNLLSGKIGLHVDGQLLTSTLARQTDFRGGYGTVQGTVY